MFIILKFFADAVEVCRHHLWFEQTKLKIHPASGVTNRDNYLLSYTTISETLAMKNLFFLLIFIPFLSMSQANNKITVDFLQAFADAFNAHDADKIMSMMTDDCIFQASAGPDVDGEKFVGKDNVRKAFQQVFTIFPDAKWANARHFLDGDRGVSEWVFSGTKSDGTHVEVTGCDLFTFRDGKISVKNSYRKNRVSK